jgi:DNA-directed RNA polymerase subunit RPC12/RpoP
MSKAEYRCLRCKAKFVEQERRYAGAEPEVKCPACSSIDVERSSIPRRVLGFVRVLWSPT